MKKNLNFTDYLNQSTQFVLKLVIVILLLAILAGIIKTFMDLQMILHENLEEALRHLVINVITLLAVVEVLKTVFSYLSDGRVKVTFIIDTVLIVMLNEIISLWFRGISSTSVNSLLFIILTLIIARFFTVKFSPDSESENKKD